MPYRSVTWKWTLLRTPAGFASTVYNRWFDHKWGGSKKEVKWVKLHLMCGVRSNIVTVADATASHSADAPYLPDFVRTTAKNFRINEVSADMAYSQQAEPPRRRRGRRDTLHPVQVRGSCEAEGQARRLSVGADVPPVHFERGRIQPALPQA